MENQPMYQIQPKKEIIELEFGHNWNNKLSCPYYTTFRMYKPGKFKINQVVSTVLKLGKTKYIQNYRQIYAIFPCLLNEVPEMFCFTDSGYGRNEFIAIVTNMYKNRTIDFTTQKFCFIMLGPLPISDS